MAGRGRQASHITVRPQLNPAGPFAGAGIMPRKPTSSRELERET